MTAHAFLPQSNLDIPARHPDLVKDEPSPIILTERVVNTIPLWSAQKTTGKNALTKHVQFQTTNEEKVQKLDIVIMATEIGLPTTVDLEYFRAFEQIVTDRFQQEGRIDNPVSVTGYDILQRARKPTGGAQYRELALFFRRMKATTIQLGRVKREHRQARRTRDDLVSLFNRVTLQGDRLHDGSLAAQYEVELADWYVQNLLAGHCFIVDQSLFLQIKRPIAQLLHQLLHNLFDHGKGGARERYSVLVENWQIKSYSSRSRIQQQLDPAHQELHQLGFLSAWHYVPVKQGRGKDYELVWEAGPAWWHTHPMTPSIGNGATDGIHNPFVNRVAWLDGDHQGAGDQEGPMIQDILAFVGARDAQFLPFWKRAVRDLSHSVIYKAMGEIRERMQHGETIKNKGGYLLTLLKIQAAKNRLPWGKK